MSHLRKIFDIFFLVQFCKSYLYSDYDKSIPFSEYYVTSTRLTTTFRSVTKFQSDVNKNCTCEIRFEKNIVYKVFFQLKYTKLVDSKTKFFVYEDNRTQDYTKTGKYFDVVQGFVLSKQNSSISGYVKESCFYGTVFVGAITYYVEDLRNYPEIRLKFPNLRNNAIIFKNNLLSLNLSQSQVGRQSSVEKKIIDLSNRNERELFQKVIGAG